MTRRCATSEISIPIAGPFGRRSWRGWQTGALSDLPNGGQVGLPAVLPEVNSQ
jgi:hypothetical protein